MNEVIKKFSAGLVILSLASSCVFASSYAENYLSKTFQYQNNSPELAVGREVTNNEILNVISVGGEQSIKVTENPSTGYQWVPTVEDSSGAISWTFEDAPAAPASPDAPMICGAGFEKTFKVKGIQKGRAKITLKQVRPWESDQEPVHTMEYVIEVQ